MQEVQNKILSDTNILKEAQNSPVICLLDEKYLKIMEKIFISIDKHHDGIVPRSDLV